MNRRTAYSYSVLRYIHDAVSGECLNIGIVLCAVTPRAFYVRTLNSLLRLQLAFPGCNTAAIKRDIARVEAYFKDGGTLSQESLEAALQTVLPASARGLQWSKVSAGVCSNPTEAVNDLFVSFVSKKDSDYDNVSVVDSAFALMYSRHEAALQSKFAMPLQQ